MDKILSSYTLALDELNILTAGSYQLAEGDMSARTSQIVDDVLSFLIKAYTLGIESASRMLTYDLSVNISSMDEAIYLVIEGKTFADRVADHVAKNDLPGLQTLAESEFHRVYNTAVQDGGEDYAGNGTASVTKTWYTMLDDKVRDTHDYLESQSVPLNANFYTWDGDYAPYPGGFTRVENNVNCRCILGLTIDN